MLRKFIITVLFLLPVFAFGQNSLPIQFTQNPSRNTQVGVLVKNASTYVSINDLARIFNLQAVTKSVATKIEVHSDDYTLKVTANNPYMVITDKKDNANLIQLPVNVVYSGNSFFVPVEPFIPILKNILTEEISYDGKKIVVGRVVVKSSFDVTGISFEDKSNGYLIRLKCSKKLTDYECWPKQIGDDTWLYITLANARADINAIRNTKPNGIIRQILAFQYPTSLQITLRLKGLINNAEPMIADNGTDILIAIQTPTPEQADARKARNYERELQQQRNKWKLDVVVIDAGHGGDDPGAIGITKVREKDVTLAIALKLGKLIEKNLPDVQVVYTRKTDNFVELYKRGQIANQKEGKLFISIHCNSLPKKKRSESGFEIYLLRPGKTESALHIAERENEVVKLEQGYEKRYQQLTEENFILLTMAQSAYVKYSERFAEILQNEMGKHLEIPNNGVKQAGFYVLVGASMPNVLVETAYLSNRHDEKILKSPTGQQRIAEAIFNGVKKYKQDYEKSLKEGEVHGTR